MAPNSKKMLIGLIGVCILTIGLIKIIDYNVTLNNLRHQYEEIPFQKGMSFTTWENYAYNTSWVRAEFDKMKAAGVEWVAINHWWWQDYLNSTVIQMGPWSDGAANMTDCFLYAKSIGLHIMYKPIINLLKTYDWRSYIIYTPEWMANYTAWMVENAKASEAGGVEILCFGTEMGNMQIHSDGVRNMIAQIREVFHGWLTYSANHDSFMYIDWYDAIDIIGISMYSMMSVAWDPTVSEMQKSWDGIYYELEELSIRWEKPILFTEIGIQATDGANMIPNDNQISQEKDVSEMRNYYLSLFQSRIWTAPWFKGAYWWIWDRAQIGDDTLKNFNPVLILDTITAEYSKTHPIESPTIPLIRTLVPFFLSIGMIILISTRKSPPANQMPYVTEIPSASNQKTNGHDYLIGLLVGSIMANFMGNLTLLVYGLIQRSFSYAIIFKISTAQISATFIGVILAGLLTALLFLRYWAKGIPYILLFAVMLYPYILLGDSLQLIFLKFYCDTLVLSLLIGALIDNHRKQPITHIFQVIATAVAVMTGNYILLLYFDTLTQVFLVIPMGLVIILMQSSIGGSETADRPATEKMPAILWLNALVAGMLIPFGNSVINLVRMNYITIAVHYIPPLIALSLFLLVLKFVAGQMKFGHRDPWPRIFSQETLLIAGLCVVGLGFAFIFTGGVMLIWAGISGLYLLLFMGTLIHTTNSIITPNRIGRNYLYLFLTAFFFVMGFMLNGIKGLLIYTVTFLAFKNGEIVRRDPTIDPVPQFDVPVLLNSIVLVTAGVMLIGGCIAYFGFRKWLQKMKNESQ